jgi:hypothetical protein
MGSRSADSGRYRRPAMSAREGPPVGHSYEEYLAVRRRLVDTFRAIDSAQSFFDFQVALADEIRATEPAAHAHRDEESRYHIRQLRLIGDALAWMALHPYALRKLSPNFGAPPSLTSQGEAFDATVDMAREYAEKGVPVVIADLTNCLSVGDVVLCADPERPTLAESGGSLERMGKGRKGRQMRRSLSILELLHKGSTTLEGNEVQTVVFEIHDEKSSSWAAVAEAVRLALDHGHGTAVHSKSDVMWAIRDDQELGGGPPPEIDQVTKGFGSACVALNSRVLEEPSPLVAPPLVWPLPPDIQLALFERDVRIVHVIDLDAFMQSETDGVRVKSIDLDDPYGVVVGANDWEERIAGRFLDDVLYGFETIESAANTIITFATHAHEHPDTAETVSTAKHPTDVALVSTMEEARVLAEDKEALMKYGYVVTTRKLFDQMRDAESKVDAHDDD